MLTARGVQVVLVVLQLGLAATVYSIVLPFYLFQDAAAALGVVHALMLATSVALYCWTASLDTTDPRVAQKDSTGPLFCHSCQACPPMCLICQALVP